MLAATEPQLPACVFMSRRSEEDIGYPRDGMEKLAFRPQRAKKFSQVLDIRALRLAVLDPYAEQGCAGTTSQVNAANMQQVRTWLSSHFHETRDQSSYDTGNELK
ncbi:hypothetical protein AK812_SmicGene23835 [Symbiodinium microadriaticum]|uniref:Uncharacterized protein n=1 Tax=Symbiodinium microadriaticum TaxID=2951 RepID=A0A1Q9DG88_SYMMI|nr:hypothetical protein AK812_SmicGene23835 [Symbiodinium microadriaticum]